MKVMLGFPWRCTDDRYMAYEITTSLMSSRYDFSAVFTVDSGHKRFNRCASRNLIVQLAEKNGADVVVINDADSVVEYPETLNEAILCAYADGLMHFPFDEAWYVEHKGMIRVRDGQNSYQIRSRIIDKCESEGGVWVCRPDTWWRAGGQDERLNGWGCDDRAFLAASRTLVGDPVKHHGILYCLPHYRPQNEEVWVPEEVRLMIDYQSAYKQPDKMKEVIDARPNLLSPESATSEERSPVIRVLQGDLSC